MYLGIVALLLSIIFVSIYKPSYFKFWKIQYSIEQFMFTMVISALVYLSQESLSIALENTKAGNIANFGFLSVLIYFLGYKFFKQVQI